jgi:hypothetical protein
MTSEQEKELAGYLMSLGFNDGTLEEQIHQHAEQRLPAFRIAVSKNYGDELMQYDLHFRRDAQFNSYRLEEYEAKHRIPVDIVPQIINDINTAELSGRMSQVDWGRYFNNGRADFDADQLVKIDAVMDDLLKLEAGNNASGWEIQKKLQYKYWPEHAYDASTIHFKHELEHRRTFSPHEEGMCNADLAFYIVSGRLNDLYEELSAVELDQYSRSDLYIELERRLAQNPDNFELRFFRNEPEALSEIKVPIIKDGNDYEVENYNATVIPHPPMEHGEFIGINTADLEQMMQQVDWHDNRKLFIIGENEEPTFPQNIIDIQEQIYRLSQDMAGSEIADRLQLKYWSDTDFLEGMIQQTAWDELDKFPKYTQDFPLTIQAMTGVNLLSGRAAKITMGDADHWLRFDLSTQDKNGLYPVSYIADFKTTDLEQMLDRIPIHQHNYYPVRNSLLRGDAVATQLKDERKIILIANPEQKTVDIYTTNGRPIPVNLRLDPDWKPSLPHTSNDTRHQQKSHQSKPIKKHKGRGLR